MAVPLKSEIWFFRSPIPDTWLDKLTSIEFDLILNPCKEKFKKRKFLTLVHTAMTGIFYLMSSKIGLKA
jgi:hypothetical protein